MDSLWTNKHFIKVSTIFVGLLSLFVVVGMFRSHDGGHGIDIQNTISFSGHGEVTAVPDIATIYFAIHKEAKTVKEAQAGVSEIEKKSLDFLKTKNVADKDIKTENASFNPKYEYRYTKAIPCNEYGCPPSNGNSVIVGYEASESITVKIRNTDDAGLVMQGLGTLGVENLNGPSFAIDDEDTLKADARKIAIDTAKMKAEKLARDLGIRLGKISSFSEGNNYPMPMTYAKSEMAVDSVGGSAPAQLPKGENTITSDVTITYEIR